MGYAFIDVETTGLDKLSDDITQFSCITTDEFFKPKGFMSVYMDTNKLIVEPVIKVTGIGNSKLKELSKGKVFSDYSKSIYDLLSDKVVVGHNIDFDFGMLSGNFNRYSDYDLSKLGLETICTMKRYKNLLKLSNYSNRPGYKYPNLTELTKYVIKNFNKNTDDVDVKFNKIFKRTASSHDALYDSFCCLYSFVLLK